MVESSVDCLAQVWAVAKASHYAQGKWVEPTVVLKVSVDAKKVVKTVQEEE